MSWSFLNWCPIVKPSNLRNGICTNAALEQKTFAIFLLSYSWFFRECRREAVDLPAKRIID